MTIQEIIDRLEAVAPRAYQESYDNSGLITGRADAACTGALICLDSTEAVVDEAIAMGCNLIIAHHPIVFSGLKSLTGRNYVERTLIKAIRHDIALYACHTNLDNVPLGVNRKIADKLGLQDARILSPKKGWLRKLYTYVPETHAGQVLDALFAAGAGHIGRYDECSFRFPGTGTFRAGEGTDPYVGKKGERHAEAEQKIEVIYPADREARILKAMKDAHPYEEVAYDIVALENTHQDLGAGMVGDLEEAVPVMDFLRSLKETMRTDCVRHTRPVKDQVRRIAVCGGAGSFLLPDAINAGADVFITGDFKYHQFFDADGRIVIADIGHYESEQFTPELICSILSQEIGNFALHLSKVVTNPINYL